MDREAVHMLFVYFRKEYKNEKNTYFTTDLDTMLGFCSL